MFSQNHRSTPKDTICNYSLKGLILDEETRIPLAYANIFIPSLQVGVASNEKGFFELKNLCKGSYHIQFSHIGCETKTRFLKLVKDTTISIRLLHYDELLHQIEVVAQKSLPTNAKNTISEESIISQSNKNLANILENIAGVSTLKSGSGIAKPVIHGLYGNRIAILNQGIVHTGQQWGSDHAPEIDIFSANHITVVKGAAALQYGGNGLGNVIKVESDPINKDPHLHGQINYIFQSNGIGHTVNGRWEKQSKWLAWRVSGTLKKQGSLHTPGYLLTNTGQNERNILLQAEKVIHKKLFLNAHYSLFSTEIGVFRGSHIGNLTDLKEAIGRERPFFVDSKFSYQIHAPRQKVRHHLFKLEAEYLPNETHHLEIRYGGQSDAREEFDIRRGGRSNKPALSMLQHTHFLETVYRRFLEKDHEFKIALQYKHVENLNDSKTGILPLIPNYLNNKIAIFTAFQKKSSTLSYQLGGRYEFQNLYASTISRSLPRRIEPFEHHFHNYALSAGIAKKITEIWHTHFDIGIMKRAPEANELYSYGLHQGVSGIEIGKKSLTEETSTKAIWHNDFSISNKLFIQHVGYLQRIKNYIYLQPQNEFLLTIRGAFPVYNYEQTNALLYGSDLLLSWELLKKVKIITKYAIVRGQDSKNQEFIVFMPSDNLALKVKYLFNEKPRRKNTSFALEGKYVFRQNKISPHQDFLAPPKGYFLFNFEVKTSILIKDTKLNFNLNIENLVNRRYRDYMNRQRYFTDEAGFSANLGINYKF